MMGSLPGDILIHIFSRLPVKSLLRFKCACKSWCSIISDPQFIKTHMNLAISDNNVNRQRKRLIVTSPFLCSFYSVHCEELDEIIAEELNYPSKKKSYEEVEFFDSCNGLLCLSPEPDTSLLVNPSTREVRNVPKVRSNCSPFAKFLARPCLHGFGYSHSIDEYKFVKIALRTCILVYSLKINIWKRVQDFPYTGHANDPGKPLNGAIHWIVRRFEDSEDQQLIGAFDLVTEKFQDLLPPVSVRNFYGLEVFGECLCILPGSALTSHNDFWVMKEYGIRESWTKIVIAIPFFDMKALCFFKDGDEALLEIDGKLVLYNLRDQTFRDLVIEGIPCGLELKAETYLESLVSPNYGCGN